MTLAAFATLRLLSDDEEDDDEEDEDEDEDEEDNDRLLVFEPIEDRSD